jgi:hypothetical protein
VGVGEGPEEVVDGEGDVEVRHVVEIAGDVGNPVIDFDLAAGGAEAGLAREGDTTVEATARADVTGVAGAGVAAEDHAFDGLADLGALVWWGLVFETQMAPGVPVVAEDVTEAVVGGGMIGVARRG